MRTIISAFLLLICNSNCYSQKFSNYYDNPFGGGVDEVISIPEGQSANGLAAGICFVDSDGNIIRACHYSVPPFQIVSLRGLAYSKADSTLVVLNDFWSTPSIRGQIIYSKLNLDGSILWANRIDRDTMNERSDAMVPLNDGKIVIVGTDYSRYVLSTDINGNFIWHYRYVDSAITGSGYTEGLVSHADNSVTLLDVTLASGKRSFGLYQLDSLGNVRWSKRYENNDHKIPLNLSSDSTGFTVVGTYNLDGFNYYPFLMRTDTAGNPLWFKVFQDTVGYTLAHSARLSDNSHVLSGQNGFASHQYRIDKDGNIIWARKMKPAYGMGPFAESLNDWIICSGYYKKLASGFGIRPWVSSIHKDSVSFCGSEPLALNVIEPVVSTVTSKITKTAITLTSPVTNMTMSTINTSVLNTCEINIPTDIRTEATEEMDVYPNPISSFVTFKFPSPIHNGQIELYNSCGQLVQTIKNITGQEIVLNRSEIDALNGMYFLVLKQEHKTVTRVKIILI